MKIAVAGDATRVKEFRMKLNQEFTEDAAVLSSAGALNAYDVIIDLNADERMEPPAYLSAAGNTLLILCAVKRSVARLIGGVHREVKCPVAGINALPSFILTNVSEVSFCRETDRPPFEKFAAETGLRYLEVQDRVGMVTPRVICMIINEACYTLQEGTAGKEDIDKGMKLGTNYPYGPFEWCDRIGIKEVYETLDAVWNGTHDPRYKICPLLKTKYLKGESFYQSSAG